jgi:hypothetical protein
MEERPGIPDPSVTTARLKPAMRGRALPLPPLVSLVVTLGVILGLLIGSGLVPKGAPLPVSGPAAIAEASPSSTGVPSVVPGPAATLLDGAAAGGLPVEMPPAGGLSLAQALKAIGASGVSASPAAVISARIVRLAEMSSSSAAAGDEWVWAIAIRGTFPLSCGPRALGTPAPCPWTTTERIVLDYQTGAALEATNPALP